MMSDDNRIGKAKSKPQVFNGNEYYKIISAIEKIAQTQFGALQEPLTGDDLKLLFVPYEYRKGLSLVYEIEDTSRARGEIWIDLMALLPLHKTYDGSIFMEPEARASIKKAVMRIYFHRDFLHNGFVTPTPLFGTRRSPIRELQEAPPRLREHFLENAGLLAQIASEWTMVRWVVHHLQNSLRTPQQMRYVWPATYNLAQTAELKMDLSTPSARAGMNAVAPQVVRPYLRETNDVVARSVLLGVNDEYITRYNRKDIMITDIEIELPYWSNPVKFEVGGV